MSSCHTEKTIGSPHTLVMDVTTSTVTRATFGRTTQRTNGEITHRVSSTGDPQSDGTWNDASRIKIRHYRQIYTDSPVKLIISYLIENKHTQERGDTGEDTFSTIC
jgi:hypothetical protein